MYSNTEREHNEIYKLFVGEEILDVSDKEVFTKEIDGFAYKLYETALDSLLRIRDKSA